MAMRKATPYSKLGMLEAVGITEDLLLGIFANDESEDMVKCTENVPDVPTYVTRSDKTSLIALKVLS